MFESRFYFFQNLYKCFHSMFYLGGVKVISLIEFNFIFSTLVLKRCHRMSNLIGGYKKEGYKIRDLIGGGGQKQGYKSDFGILGQGYKNRGTKFGFGGNRDRGTKMGYFRGTKKRGTNMIWSHPEGYKNRGTNLILRLGVRKRGTKLRRRRKF